MRMAYNHCMPQYYDKHLTPTWHDTHTHTHTHTHIPRHTHLSLLLLSQAGGDKIIRAPQRRQTLQLSCLLQRLIPVSPATLPRTQFTRHALIIVLIRVLHVRAVPNFTFFFGAIPKVSPLGMG